MPLSVIEPIAKKQEPQLLTANVLQNPVFQLSISSVNQRILDFIQCQDTYRDLYLLEGGDYASKRDRDESGTGGEKPVAAPSLQLCGAFASPILKARNPTTSKPQELPQKQKPENRRAESISLCACPTEESIQAALLEQPQPHQSAKLAKRQCSERSLGENENKENVPEASLDVEEVDRIKRMAERRDRKRAKREILKSPVISSSSASSNFSDNSSQSGSNDPTTQKKTGNKMKNTKVQRKKKKKRRNAVHPGTALMQNFSAHNLGQERITLKPSRNLGLFHKGRSSGQLDIQSIFKIPNDLSTKHKGSKSLTKDPAFSQFAFSKKKRTSTLRDGPSKALDQRSTGDAKKYPESKFRSRKGKVQDSTQNKPRNTNTPDQISSPVPMKKTHLPISPPSVSAEELDVEEARSFSDHSKKQPARYWSPPWEIDGELVGEPARVEDSPNIEPTSLPEKSDCSHSMIIDVSEKWNLPPQSHLEPLLPNSNTSSTSQLNLGSPRAKECLLVQGEVKSRYFSQKPIEEKGMASGSFDEELQVLNNRGVEEESVIQEQLDASTINHQGIQLTQHTLGPSDVQSCNSNLPSPTFGLGHNLDHPTERDNSSQRPIRATSYRMNTTKVDELLREVDLELNGCDDPHHHPRMLIDDTIGYDALYPVASGTRGFERDTAAMEHLPFPGSEFDLQGSAYEYESLIDTESDHASFQGVNQLQFLNRGDYHGYEDSVPDQWPMERESSNFGDDANEFMVIEEHHLWNAGINHEGNLGDVGSFDDFAGFDGSYYDYIENGLASTDDGMDQCSEDQPTDLLAQFSQGRALLLGVEDIERDEEGTNGLSDNFYRNHWKR